MTNHPRTRSYSPANGATRVWDIHSGKLLCAVSVSHRRPVTALAFSLPAGATLVAAHGEGGGRAKAGAPVGEHELQDVPTAYIKAGGCRGRATE